MSNKSLTEYLTQVRQKGCNWFRTLRHSSRTTKNHATERYCPPPSYASITTNDCGMLQPDNQHQSYTDEQLRSHTRIRGENLLGSSGTTLSTTITTEPCAETQFGGVSQADTQRSIPQDFKHRVALKRHLDLDLESRIEAAVELISSTSSVEKLCAAYQDTPEFDVALKIVLNDVYKESGRLRNLIRFIEHYDQNEYPAAYRYISRLAYRRLYAIATYQQGPEYEMAFRRVTNSLRALAKADTLTLT